MKNLVLVSIFCCLTGCVDINKSDFASNDKDQFTTSKNGKDLVIPPTLTSSNLSDFYQLPEQSQNPKIGVTPPV